MGRSEPDTGELLVRALDQVVGGIALARYAASRTNDGRLRDVFNRLAATSEQQERMLRRHLAGYPWQAAADSAPRRATQIAVGAAMVALGFAGAAMIAVILRAYQAGVLPAWAEELVPRRLSWLRPPRSGGLPGRTSGP